LHLKLLEKMEMEVVSRLSINLSQGQWLTIRRDEQGRKPVTISR